MIEDDTRPASWPGNTIWPMNNEIRPAEIDALPPGARASFEWADGPVVVAFRADLRAVWAPETAWHAHMRGQLMYVEQGVLTVHTEHGTSSLPPGCAGWMPPGQQHTVELAGPLRGWGVVVRPDACSGLPARSGVIRLSGLAREVIMRAASWPLSEMLGEPVDPARQRLAAVLLDELCQAPIEHLHLPMPADRRLLRIARQLLNTPADPRPLEAWATWGGLSPRSLSRHFPRRDRAQFCAMAAAGAPGRGPAPAQPGHRRGAGGRPARLQQPQRLRQRLPPPFRCSARPLSGRRPRARLGIPRRIRIIGALRARALARVLLS